MVTDTGPAFASLFPKRVLNKVRDKPRHITHYSSQASGKAKKVILKVKTRTRRLKV